MIPGKAAVPLSALVLALASFAWPRTPPPAAAERARPIPRPAADVTGVRGLQTAILAGGCFWTMEGMFEHVKGVKSVTSGYTGGTAQTANYRDVSSERTAHAESVRIVYDPAHVSYGTLLCMYFSVAQDPTQLNRQAPDRGPSNPSA